jgi:hypothetical protein
MKNKKILQTIVICMVVTLIPIACFAATPANGLETAVNSGYNYLWAGFKALCKAGGILGLIASIIGIAVTQDQDSLKKLKVALVVSVFAVAFGFGAQAIIDGIAV